MTRPQFKNYSAHALKAAAEDADIRDVVPIRGGVRVTEPDRGLRTDLTWRGRPSLTIERLSAFGAAHTLLKTLDGPDAVRAFEVRLGVPLTETMGLEVLLEA